ncbi:MAG TPA: hypothetical protein DDZ80_01430 [Cyanobacteria bacterium UBA8803]|nr:hypothetical protein [Cyanobacteria bacterium UBA9273]HBL57265.1 hypothetical protein [Cyanobacteria bacterium UBA8803]
MIYFSFHFLPLTTIGINIIQLIQNFSLTLGLKILEFIGQCHDGLFTAPDVMLVAEKPEYYNNRHPVLGA